MRCLRCGAGQEWIEGNKRSDRDGELARLRDENADLRAHEIDSTPGGCQCTVCKQHRAVVREWDDRMVTEMVARRSAEKRATAAESRAAELEEARRERTKAMVALELCAAELQAKAAVLVEECRKWRHHYRQRPPGLMSTAAGIADAKASMDELQAARAATDAAHALDGETRVLARGWWWSQRPNEIQSNDLNSADTVPCIVIALDGEAFFGAAGLEYVAPERRGVVKL